MDFKAGVNKEIIKYEKRTGKKLTDNEKDELINRLSNGKYGEISIFGKNK